jgi:CRP/FNR family cyclic AMP-dependent transcriptional regulator
MTEASHFTLLLGANPFFGGMGPQVLSVIASLCVKRSVSAGEVLFFKGDPGDALYAVRKGQIRIGTGNDAGRRLTLNLLGSGDIFGEVALLDGKPRTADAVAVESTDLFMIRRRDFVDLLARNPTVAVQIIELLCERIRYMSSRMEESTLLPLSSRLARRLEMLAADFGSDISVSQEELAVFVGSTRESVNRQLQTWKRGGLIEVGRNRVCLTNRDGLSLAAAEI